MIPNEMIVAGRTMYKLRTFVKGILGGEGKKR